MDGINTLEASLITRENVVLDVQCYYFVYFVCIVYSLIVPMVLSAYCVYGIVCIFHMQCWV